MGNKRWDELHKTICLIGIDFAFDPEHLLEYDGQEMAEMLQEVAEIIRFYSELMRDTSHPSYAECSNE